MPVNDLKKKPSRSSRPITAVVANERGEIFDLAGYAAVGSDGPVQECLSVQETCNLPHGSELMFLPDRIPLVFDLQSDAVVALAENPYEPGEAIFPVAAFNSPGYVITHTGAWEERTQAVSLPLFSYGAVGWHRGKFRSAIVQVDKEPRQDLRRMPDDKVAAGVRELRQTLAGNRLRAHLENCALNYGCPAGKNFFLGRYEAPLPASSSCNARCLGCLSLQPDDTISCSQDRIDFTPSPEEIAQVALTHIKRVEHAVVSFGQGCEGDPLMAADTIARAIRKIRANTDRGTINMNTNGSLPKVLDRLFDAGLDSIRVSMNSVREKCYRAYFRPKGYRFTDVLESIALGIRRGRHVAINYLNMAGVTDSPEETAALFSFLEEYPIHQIQWRNMNYDPLRYLKAMAKASPQGTPIGMKNLVKQVKSRFPSLRHGYFNPYLNKC